MTVTIPNPRSRQEAVAAIDKAADDLFARGEAGNIDLIDPKKEWTGFTMSFSVNAGIGFINIPLSGSVEVDESNVIVTCELPRMVQNFVGEAKVRQGITEKVAELLSA